MTQKARFASWRLALRTAAVLGAVGCGQSRCGATAAPEGAANVDGSSGLGIDSGPSPVGDGCCDVFDGGREAGAGGAKDGAGGSTTDVAVDVQSEALADSWGGPSDCGAHLVPGQSCSGGLDCGGRNCCERLPVAAGQFPMGRGVDTDACPPGMSCDPADQPEHLAIVDSFLLETYEVTVGRFRAFVGCFDGTPPSDGSGAHPLIAGSGWQDAWNSSLPKSRGELVAALKCHSVLATWTDVPGSQERLPINCVEWYIGFAFCVWDGGRLPTEAEWEYAAAGGSENRLYPWGASTPDNSVAVFDSQWGGSPGKPELSDIAPVGSVPGGAGRWGQMDLAGNLSEWVLDWFGSYGAACNNCANLSAGAGRVPRSGTWTATASYLRAAARGFLTPGTRNALSGVRCAASP
jgi:formylglycine-generating enzyme required for sulfatase activity